MWKIHGMLGIMAVHTHTRLINMHESNGTTLKCDIRVGGGGFALIDCFWTGLRGSPFLIVEHREDHGPVLQREGGYLFGCEITNTLLFEAGGRAEDGSKRSQSGQAPSFNMIKTA